jgi:hypothetical protein
MAALACALLGSLAPSAADAAEPERYEVSARITDDVLHVTTTVRLQAAGERLRFWLYADRLAEPPAAMDDLSAQWVYPREVDRAPVTVEAVRLNGEPVRWERRRPTADATRDRAGSDLVLLTQARGEVTVTLETRQPLPERFGRIGRTGDRIALLGPWYPLLVDDHDWAFEVPHRVSLAFDEPMDTAGGVRLHEERGAWRGEGRCAFVPVLAMDERHEERETLRGPGGDPFTLRLIAPYALYRAPETRDATAGLRDMARIDVMERVADVVQGALQTMAMAGIAPAQRSLRVVLAPSRTELAATAPGLVLVSDRIYELFPYEDLTDLHDRVLARVIFRALLEPVVGPREPLADRDWAVDLRAVLLADLDTLRRRGELQTARDLIDWAGFHPSIDQLLYAPQIAFVDTYFGTVAEPERFGEDPVRARRPRARGRRILEHGRDRLSEDEFRRMAARLLRTERPARSILTRAGIDDDTIALWLASPGLPVNYRLGAIRSERSGDGWTHHVEVVREGADRPEPVTVRVIDEDGNTVDGTWDGAGEVGTVTLETPAERSQVLIDPERRLPQSKEVAEGHPYADDAEVLPFRPPIIQAVNLAASGTERNIIGLIDFVVRRQYDLERTWGMRLTTGPRATGGLLRYTQLFGRKRDGNNRIGAATAGLTFDRLRGGFSASGEGGWRTGILLSAGYSTLRYFLDPHRGSRLVGSLRYGLTRRDDGRITHTVAASTRGNVTIPIGLRNVLTLVADVSWVFGDPLPSERPGLGGRFLLRGYQSDELIGEGRAFVVAEHRFTPTIWSDLDIDVFHLIWIRRLQLAVFAGAGLVYEVDDGRQIAFGAEVGGGLRVHFEYGGVQPAVLSLDVARPLIRNAEASAARAPVTFVFGFEQYF